MVVRILVKGASQANSDGGVVNTRGKASLKHHSSKTLRLVSHSGVDDPDRSSPLSRLYARTTHTPKRHHGGR
jgi:hypothetical protein